MTKRETTEEAKNQIDALKRLARDGATTAHNLEESPLVQLEPVTEAVGSDAAPVLKADAFVQLLVDTVTQRLGGKDKEKAEALFALGEWAGVSMADRYHHVAKLHDPKAGNWEKFRKEPLTDFLITVLTALHREGAKRRAERASSHIAVSSTPDHRSPLISGDIALDRYEVLYNLPTIPGEPRETLEIREVRALRDGVEKWQVPSQYWGMNPDTRPSLKLFGPGTLEMVRDQRNPQSPYAGRVYIPGVTFPTPLRAGETIRFGILRSHPVAFEDVVRDSGADQKDVTPFFPIDFARIGVRFPADHIPSAVWHFEDVPEYLGSGSPDESNRLTVDSSGFVSYSWDHLLIGHSYGIAWRW